MFGEDAEGFGWVCVLDDRGRLLGVVSITHLALASPAGRRANWLINMDIASCRFRRTPTRKRRIASAPGQRVFGPLRLSVQHRLPWLLVNLGTVLAAAAVVNLFESTIAAVAMLAVFLPVVAGQGGIAGTQMVTLVVRGLALWEVPHQSGIRLLGRELLLGLFHGLALALVAGLLGWVWKGSIGLGLAIVIAMVGNLLVSALAGAGVPLLLRRFGIDPAVSSVVFVTTFTDIFGFPRCWWSRRTDVGMTDLIEPRPPPPCHKSRNYFTIESGAGAPWDVSDEQAQHHVASWQSDLH